ncbi:hypothetical protein IWX49DRAFT_566624 [Phyllosticta citricarpa]|uniref:Uncharacterized protein n=1 Tax=Phyllosticta paracitricarpa TaxID=2016321 RepID=A0ABR1NIL5_9PEZI
MDAAQHRAACEPAVPCDAGMEIQEARRLLGAPHDRRVDTMTKRWMATSVQLGQQRNDARSNSKQETNDNMMRMGRGQLRLCSRRAGSQWRRSVLYCTAGVQYTSTGNVSILRPARRLLSTASDWTASVQQPHLWPALFRAGAVSKAAKRRSDQQLYMSEAPCALHVYVCRVANRPAAPRCEPGPFVMGQPDGVGEGKRR